MLQLVELDHIRRDVSTAVLARFKDERKKKYLDLEHCITDHEKEECSKERKIKKACRK